MKIEVLKYLPHQCFVGLLFTKHLSSPQTCSPRMFTLGLTSLRTDFTLDLLELCLHLGFSSPGLTWTFSPRWPSSSTPKDYRDMICIYKFNIDKWINMQIGRGGTCQLLVQKPPKKKKKKNTQTFN